METKELRNEIRKGIVLWYPFRKDSKILLVGDENSSIVDNFDCAAYEVNAVDSVNDASDTYDYILFLHAFEKEDDILLFLKKCKSLLNKKGIILFAMDNRFGIRYFCGDKDPYTNRNFDGIENYKLFTAQDIERLDGRLYDKAQILDYLKTTGFNNIKYYSVFPNIDMPQLIYAQDYLPQEDLSMRLFPLYNNPEAIFLNEKQLYEDLIKNNLFHEMANGYILECSIDGELQDINHVTLSLDRGASDAMITTISGDGIVRKKALYQEGIEKINQIDNNHKRLKACGIKVIEGKVNDSAYVMPYINMPIAVKYLQDLLRVNKEMFVGEIDKFRNIILQSSEHIEASLSEYEECEVPSLKNSVWLKEGYFDLVPLNAFRIEDDYVFFDQEFCIENYPANALILRTIDIIYGSHTDLENILPREFFWKRYDMEKQVGYLRKKTNAFTKDLRNQKILNIHNNLHSVNNQSIHSNRLKINFSANEYQKMFINVLDDIDKYKIIIFGSGTYAKHFINLYGKKCDIYAVVDNNSTKWGTKLEGKEICSPQLFHDINVDECKIIICIKNYVNVLKQVTDAGFNNIGIYDTNMVYSNKNLENYSRQSTKPLENNDVATKKYKIGYMSGVFDLFHIGHLNMFKRAKEQCEYLIVGVVSDEGVRKHKQRIPFIPFEERIEMVRACKYVDEAVKIPLDNDGTRDAFKMYHFDVQFFGSDYEQNPYCLADREFLRKNGSDIVFFPYTEQTSSTKIKALINKQLEEK